MSYRCEECGNQVQPGTKRLLVTTAVRVKTYNNGRVGRETVTEKAVCANCRETLLKGLDANEDLS